MNTKCHCVNIGEFVQRFNEKTKNTPGITIPVEITVYMDRTFDFITKSPPASVLLKKAAGLPLTKKPSSGAGNPGSELVGQVTIFNHGYPAVDRAEVANLFHRSGFYYCL